MSSEIPAVEFRRSGSWQVGTSEQDMWEGNGRVWAWLKRLFTEPAGFHGNLVFLFLKSEVPQQLPWVLEPPVRVGARFVGVCRLAGPGAVGGGEAGE